MVFFYSGALLIRVLYRLGRLNTFTVSLPKDLRYLVTDALYSKQTFTHGVLECGYHQIGKLRQDANLRYLFTGQQRPKGRHKRYDGKLIIGDISRLDFVGEYNGAVSG